MSGPKNEGLQLGSAFRDRTAPAPSSPGGDSDQERCSGPSDGSPAIRRRSTAADVLANMLGSSTAFSSPVKGMNPPSSQQQAQAPKASDDMVLGRGLASPAQLEQSLAQDYFRISSAAGRPSNSFHAPPPRILHQKKYSHASSTKSLDLAADDFTLRSPFALDGLVALPPIKGLFGTPEQQQQRRSSVSLKSPTQSLRKATTMDQHLQQKDQHTPEKPPALPRVPDSASRFPTPDTIAQGRTPRSSWSPSQNMAAAAASSSRATSTRDRGSSVSSLRHPVLAHTPEASPQRLSKLSSSNTTDEDEEEPISPAAPLARRLWQDPRDAVPAENNNMTDVPPLSPSLPQLSPDDFGSSSAKSEGRGALGLGFDPESPLDVPSKSRGTRMSMAPRQLSQQGLPSLPSDADFMDFDKALSDLQDSLKTAFPSDSQADLVDQFGRFGGEDSRHVQAAPAAESSLASRDEPSVQQNASSNPSPPLQQGLMEPPPSRLDVPSSDSLPLDHPQRALSPSAFSNFSSDEAEASSRGRQESRPRSIFGIKLPSKNGRSGSRSRTRTTSVKSPVLSNPTSPFMSDAEDLEPTHRNSGSRRSSFSNRLSGILSRKKKVNSANVDGEAVPPTPALPAEYHIGSPPRVTSPETKAKDLPAAGPKPKTRASSIFNRRISKVASSPSLAAGLGISFKPDADAPPVPVSVHSTSALSAPVYNSFQIASAPIGRSMFSPKTDTFGSLPALTTPSEEQPSSAKSVFFPIQQQQHQHQQQQQTDVRFLGEPAAVQLDPNASSHYSQSDASTTDRSHLFDTSREASTPASLYTSPNPMEDLGQTDSSGFFEKPRHSKAAGQEDNSREELDESHVSRFTEDGSCVWPPRNSLFMSGLDSSLPPSSALGTSQAHFDSSASQEHDESSQEVMQPCDGSDGFQKRNEGASFAQQAGPSASNLTSSVDGMPASSSFNNAFARRRAGRGDAGSSSDSDSSDGFGHRDIDNEAPIEEVSEDNNSDSEDDVPLAQMHPGAVQAQREMREEQRKARRKSKAAALARSSPNKKPVPNPFQFKSTMMSTEPLKKGVPYVGEPARKRSSTPQPEYEGHSLLPQTDESVLQRNRALSTSRGTHPKHMLPPFVQDSVLAFSEGESSSSITSEASVAHITAGLARAKSSAHPARQGVRVPTRAPSYPMPTAQQTEMQSREPQRTNSPDSDGRTITVYLKTLDGSCTVQHATTAEKVIQDVLARGLISDPIQTLALWEVWNGLGLERPIRPAENLSAIMDTWDQASAVFMVKRLPPKASDNQCIPVHAEVKAGKWSKRYLTVGDLNPSVRLQKSEKGGDVTILCSLASFDVYMANTTFFAHKRPPKPSMLVLKTTESLRIFENAEEAMHMLCFSSQEQRDAAFLLLQKRRSLHLRERRAQAAAAAPPPARKDGMPPTRLLSFDSQPEDASSSDPPKSSDSAFTTNGLVARSRTMSRAPATDASKAARKDAGFTGSGLLARSQTMSGGQQSQRPPPLPASQHTDLHRARTTASRPQH